MYVLAFVVFGANEILVSRISLESGQIVLRRTLVYPLPWKDGCRLAETFS